MSRKITQAYQRSENIYDTLLTQGSWWSRLYMRLFWDGVSDLAIAEELLSHIPAGFAGRLLDVPVGTAVFTHQAYLQFPEAEVLCLDYSEAMLQQARRRFKANGINNVTLLQGDVAQLPIETGSCDIVMSMNGFHAFPDKKRAFTECFRVLKPGGSLLGCCYVQGINKRTDWLVRRILAPKGWFTPPFNSLDTIHLQMTQHCEFVSMENRGAMALFFGKKAVEGTP